MVADDRVSVAFFLAVNALLTAVAQPGNDFALYLRVEQIESDFRGRLHYENEIDL